MEGQDECQARVSMEYALSEVGSPMKKEAG